MFTEREVFPSFENMYLFLLIAMMVNLARLSRAPYLGMSRAPLDVGDTGAATATASQWR